MQAIRLLELKHHLIFKVYNISTGEFFSSLYLTFSFEYSNMVVMLGVKNNGNEY